MNDQLEKDKHLLNIGKCYKDSESSVYGYIYNKIIDYNDCLYTVRSLDTINDSIIIFMSSAEPSGIEITHEEYKEALKKHLKKTGLLRDAGVE